MPFLPPKRPRVKSIASPDNGFTALKFYGEEDGHQIVRHIVIINGIPFYCSSGKSKGAIIKSEWREDMYMPFAGIETGGDRADHIGVLKKLGDCLPPAIFDNNKVIFRKNLVSFIEQRVKQADKETLDRELKFLLTERGLASLSVDEDVELNSSQIEDILDNLSTEFMRFGTIETLIISMYTSPDAWGKIPFLGHFREFTLAQYPEYAFYADMDLENTVPTANTQLALSANQGDQSRTKLVANCLNDQLYLEICTNEDYQYISKPLQISRKKDNSVFATAALAAITGTLILNSILNIGLLSGAGGAILAGLSTAAAATGFGLIGLAVVCFVLGCVFACRSMHQKNIAKRANNEVQDEQVTTRGYLVEFLRKNTTNKDVLDKDQEEEREALMERARKEAAQPKDIEKGSFFHHRLRSIAHVLGCGKSLEIK